MKKIFLALIAAVCSMSISAQVMEIMKGGKVVATYTADQADQVVFKDSKTPEPPQPGTHEYVDLGLSVKWATCNVGANAPEDYGLFFAWGETTGYTQDISDGYIFDWANYKWCNGSPSTMTKYCTDSSYGTVDNKTTLDPEDDAATANWGGSWRMPTREEQEELLNNCTWTWNTQKGVNGYKVIGKNGNSIFLPAAGYRYDGYLGYVGSSGLYWSSSIYPWDSIRACYLGYRLSTVDGFCSHRYYGQSVRAVCP